MALTPKQEAFCLAYLKTGNASEAYRLSYDAKKMKPETVNRTAKELIDNPKIAARMAELNASAVTDAVMTRQEALERLSRFARTDLADLVEFGSYEIGEQDGQPVIQAAWKIKDSVLQDPQKMAASSKGRVRGGRPLLRALLLQAAHGFEDDRRAASPRDPGDAGQGGGW